ncbi:esterase/lipase family protein [Nannocystaceae bacterium ST9]
MQVFLVPGFFGFQVLAGLPYFFGVRELLRDALAARGVAARVHALDTLPTASLENRARYLAEKLLAIVSRDGSPVHIIGHSTGGLDARVLLSRDAPLTGLRELDDLRSRVRSLVTVSTPHHGTPLAALLERIEGQKLLRLIGLLGVHGLRFAGRPLVSALAIGRLLGRLDELVLLRESALDRAYALLVDPLSRDRLAPVEDFAAAVRRDQTLIRQLRPSAMAGFSDHYRLDPRIVQGCVLTRARPPGLRGPVEVGLDPVGQLSHAIYQGLYRLCSTQRPETQPEPTPSQRARLIAEYGKVPTSKANDAMVPTRSQLHERVVHVARADHHDVIGYFDDPDHDPPHIDWVVTGSGFRRPGFERLWTAVADHIVLAGEG